MKTKKEGVDLDLQGVDKASALIQGWLTEADLRRQDMLRIRLTMEELLAKVCRHGGEGLRAELSFTKRVGAGWLRIRYGGERYDPTRSADDALEELSDTILAQTGFIPSWR